MKIKLRFVQTIARSSYADHIVKTCSMDLPAGTPGWVVIERAAQWAGWPLEGYSVRKSLLADRVRLEVEFDASKGDVLTIILLEPDAFALEPADLIAPIRPSTESTPSKLALLGLWVVSIAGLAVILIRSLYFVFRHPNRAKEVLLRVDRTTNGCIGGDLDESISSRAYRAEQRGRRWGCVLCGILDWFDKWHCKKSAGK